MKIRLIFDTKYNGINKAMRLAWYDLTIKLFPNDGDFKSVVEWKNDYCRLRKYKFYNNTYDDREFINWLYNGVGTNILVTSHMITEKYDKEISNRLVDKDEIIKIIGEDYSK